MTFKTLLLAGASVVLLSACSSPFEYNTYEVDKKPSSYGKDSWTFRGDNDDQEEKVMVNNSMEEDMSAPVDLNTN